VQVLLFNHSNFLNKQSNPRLLAYYNYLQEQGQSPCFCFLKASPTNPNTFRYKQFGNQKLPGFLNTFWGVMRACIFLIYKRPKQVYIYGSHGLYLPIYAICKVAGMALTIEKTELDSIKPTTSIKDKLNVFLYGIDENLMSVFQPRLVVITPLLEKFYREKKLRQVHITGLFLPNQPQHQEAIIKTAKQIIIGYLGSFAHKDDLTTLLAACEKLASEKTKIHLILIGAAHEIFDINNSFLTIDYKGELESNQIQAVLTSCHVLVAIRKNNLYSNYGFPSKLGEYFLSGRPIICAKNIVLPVDFENEKNIYRVQPEKVNQLADTIAIIEENYDQAAAIGALGKETALATYNSKIILGDWYNFVFKEEAVKG
jgi:glycosyltransferase involved in cell wall biosynthesis